ncbi:MAG: hypothetical protein Q7R43_05800 [Candidatus Daviesbacteria bacterium]|nr:hypothetical protein [Candidatus Daviesbacteria bacterium]
MRTENEKFDEVPSKENPIQLTEEQISLAKARYILNCVFEDLEKEEQP